MNRIYVFEYIDGITDQYHNGGGLAIVTKSDDPAKVFMDAYPDLEPDFANCEPPTAYPVPEGAEERIYVFADGGCC